MTVKKFNLPDVGEGLTEAEVVAWKVKPGDTVAINDVLCEIETAKSLVELPSPYAGTVTELLVEEGITVEVGTPIVAVSEGQPGEAVPQPQAPAAGAETASSTNQASHPQVSPRYRTPDPCMGSFRRTTVMHRPAAPWLAPDRRRTPSSAVPASVL